MGEISSYTAKICRNSNGWGTVRVQGSGGIGEFRNALWPSKTSLCGGNREPRQIWKTPQLTHAQTAQTISWYHDISCLDSCLFNELNTLNRGNVESPRVTLTRVSAGRPLASTKLRPGRKSWTSEDSEDEVRQKALANAQTASMAKQHVTEMALSNTSALCCKFVVCHFLSFSHGWKKLPCM